MFPEIENYIRLASSCMFRPKSAQCYTCSPHIKIVGIPFYLYTHKYRKDIETFL